MNRRCVAIIFAVFMSIIILMPVFFSPQPFNDEENTVIQKTRALETYETEHYRVLHPPGKEFFARWVSNYAEEIFDDAVAFANYTPTTLISIQIVEDSQFNGWLNTGDRNGMKIAFQSEWSIDWNNDPSLDLKRIIAHELNHVLLSRRLNVANMGYSDLPWWFYDGLAGYYGDMFSNPSREVGYRIILKDYLEQEEFKNFNEMVNWDGLNGLYGYVEGYFVFKYIEWTYGIDTVREFADKAAANGSTEGGFIQTFNMTQNDFETIWQTWVRDNYTLGYNYEMAIYGEPIANGTASDFSTRYLSSWRGDEVLFVSAEDGNIDIYLMNLTINETTKLTNNWATDTDPMFSHDGSKILYTSAEGDNFGVYVMDKDGSNITGIVTDEYVNTAAGWHPGDDEILFVSSRAGNYDIYSVNLDGTGTTQLTTDTASDGDPRFSSDGKKIIFVSNRSGSYELYMMNSDGSNVERLTDMQGKNVDNPHWPPGENYVLFEAMRPSWNNSIYKFDLDSMTTELILGPLPNNTWMNIYYPVWSEDGSEILFVWYGEIYRHKLFEPPASEDNDIWMPLIIIVILALIGGSMLTLRRKKRQDDVDDDRVPEVEETNLQEPGHGSSGSSDGRPDQ